MKMHILSGGRLRMRKSVYLPSSERSETIELPVSCVLLRHPQGNVLVDTGCHPITATNPESRWGTMAKAMIPISGPEDNVIRGLSMLGLQPDDIDVVINSHFHSDHCGCNEFFRRSTVFCHYRELEAAHEHDAQQKGYLPIDWQHPMLTKTVDGEHDLFGDGRVTLLPLPGHTPGTLGTKVDLDRDGSFLMAADAIPLRQNLEQEIMPRNTWNPELATQSMDEIRRLQASGTTVIFGHDADQWHSLRKGADAYE